MTSLIKEYDNFTRFNISGFYKDWIGKIFFLLPFCKGKMKAPGLHSWLLGIMCSGRNRSIDFHYKLEIVRLHKKEFLNICHRRPKEYLPFYRSLLFKWSSKFKSKYKIHPRCIYTHFLFPHTESFKALPGSAIFPNCYLWSWHCSLPNSKWSWLFRQKSPSVVALENSQAKSCCKIKTRHYVSFLQSFISTGSVSS